MFEPEITAESDFMRDRRRELEERKIKEDNIYIAVEAEKSYEELPGGQETPEFGDGTDAILLKLRESIAKQLYEDLDDRYGDDDG